MAARRMFGTRDFKSVASSREQHASCSHSHEHDYSGRRLQKNKKENKNRQTRILQNLKTVIYRVIEITSKRTQIVHGAKAYISSLGSMETSWRRKGYWENQNGGEPYFFHFLLGICNVSGEN